MSISSLFHLQNEKNSHKTTLWIFAGRPETLGKDLNWPLIPQFCKLSKNSVKIEFEEEKRRNWYQIWSFSYEESPKKRRKVRNAMIFMKICWIVFSGLKSKKNERDLQRCHWSKSKEDNGRSFCSWTFWNYWLRILDGFFLWNIRYQFKSSFLSLLDSKFLSDTDNDRRFL